MQIVEIDEPRICIQSRKRQNWQSKFRKSVYAQNFIHKICQKEKQLNEYENGGKLKFIVNIVEFVKEHSNQELKIQEFCREKCQNGLKNNMITIKDTQQRTNYYSPYSNFIPLKDQSFIANQIVNTFPFAKYLQDTNFDQDLRNIEEDFSDKFGYNKRKISQKVASFNQSNQWLDLKRRYLCGIDSIQALSIYIEVQRHNCLTLKQLFQQYGKQVKQKIFNQRIFRTSRFLRPNNRMHTNIPVSIMLQDQINSKTVPESMKTWYCSICFIYDCQRHQKQSIVINRNFEYIHPRNAKTTNEHIKSIGSIIKFYEELKNGQSQQKEQQQHKHEQCSSTCYLKLKKQDLLKLNMNRHQLISPLASALLKLGVQLFSYNPCKIQTIFQNTNNITCSLIFIHLVVECELVKIIDQKNIENQENYLMNERINEQTYKIPHSKVNKKLKEKMENSMEPEIAICFHNFVGDSIDPQCNNCVCKTRGFCTSSCMCGQFCSIKKEGCKCKDSCDSSKCICYLNDMQCEPGVCLNCFPKEKEVNKHNSCQNEQIMRRSCKKVIVGLSEIPGAGLGCFANENISKNSLVLIYSGENVSLQIDHMRECLIQDLSFYNFDSPNRKKINASIDARFKGNKARFINHCNDGRQNIMSKTKFSHNSFYIALYAKKDIKIGEELTFNYDGNGELFYNHRDKYPFIQPPKKK